MSREDALAALDRLESAAGHWPDCGWLAGYKCDCGHGGDIATIRAYLSQQGTRIEVFVSDVDVSEWDPNDELATMPVWNRDGPGYRPATLYIQEEGES